MRTLFAVGVVLLAASPAAAEDYPHVYLKNDKLKVKVYLPDAEKGYYRGTRFDWAGVCGEVEFAGHKIFLPWKDKHDPTNHDDILGPAEEFGMEAPLGYDEAKPGETFLKIGVGELEKPKEEKYSFAKKYKIVKPAVWKETQRYLENPPEFFENLVWESQASLPTGYGYTYRKGIQLTTRKDEAWIAITHELKNTGTKLITTDFYNHNFFNVDGDPIGPNYRIVFPVEVKAKELRGKFGELVDLSGKELRFKDKLTEGFVMAELIGLARADYSLRWIMLEHRPSTLRVTVLHTGAFEKFNLWAVKTAICPEPFMKVSELQPGRGVEWVIWYRFSHDPQKK